MISPRTYQSESVYKLIPDSFRSGHTAVIRYAPMRSGKSIEQALMAKGAYEKGNRVILLTHRSKIFSSTFKHLSNAGIPFVDFKAGDKIPTEDWTVMLAMERSLWNVIRKSPDSILQPVLLLVDEIHLNNFSKIIDFFKTRGKLFIVAFSGTPTGKHLHKYFTAILSNVDSEDLIASGDLVKCKAFQMQDEDIDSIKKNKGEFDDKAMFEHYNKAQRYDGILKEYNNKVKNLKGIVFCCNIDHTVKTYEKFKEAGINAFMVHSGNKTYKMSEQEKESMIIRFEDSTDGVMINQGVLDTGYDNPSMMWVGVDRATTSLALWLQMASRAATPYPGKTEYVLLDFGMNHNRHGHVHQPRTWFLTPPKKRSNKIQPAPIKKCPQCEAVISARANSCEYCQFVFPVNETELKEGVMIEVLPATPKELVGKRISELSIEELIELQKSKKYKSSFIWRTIRSKGEESLRDYAKLMGYKSGWIYNQKQKMQDSKFSNYILK